MLEWLHRVAPSPLPVLVLYWTVGVGEDGALRFFDDIYDRDERIARALEAPFALELPAEE